MSDTNPIPESYRRKALYAALHHHDRVKSAGTVTDDGPVTVEIRAGLGRIPEARRHRVPGPDETRQYIKRVAGALGFAYTATGEFRAKLTPDTEHALAGLRGEYNDTPGARP